MKKKKKIYAIPGMMEYQTHVFVGRNPVKVTFSGGSINNGCARPARFVTSSLIIQNAVEASEDFRRGRIRLERSITLDEDIPLERPRPAMSGMQPTEPETPVGAEASEDVALGEPEHSDEPADSDGSEHPAEPALEVVEASCKDVAKAYLQDRFGENPAPLRTRDDVQNCAARHGITFKFV